MREYPEKPAFGSNTHYELVELTDSPVEVLFPDRGSIVCVLHRATSASIDVMYPSDNPMNRDGAPRAVTFAREGLYVRPTGLTREEFQELFVDPAKDPEKERRFDEWLAANHPDWLTLREKRKSSWDPERSEREE